MRIIHSFACSSQCFPLLPGRESQFKKVPAHNIDNNGSPYDYGSVMHYPDWAFAKRRGLKTIRALRGNPVSNRSCSVSNRSSMCVCHVCMHVCKTLFKDAGSVSNLLVSTEGVKQFRCLQQ